MGTPVSYVGSVDHPWFLCWMSYICSSSSVSTVLTCTGDFTGKAFSSSGFWLHLARSTSGRSKGRGEGEEHLFTQLPLYQVTVTWLFPLSEGMCSFFPVALSMQVSSSSCCNHSPCLLRLGGCRVLLLVMGFPPTKPL